MNGSIFDFDSFAEFGIPVLPEANEINVDITTDQEGLGYDVSSLLREIYAAGDTSTLEFGSYMTPSTLVEGSYTAQQIQEILGQQRTRGTQSFGSDNLQVGRGSSNESIVTTNNPARRECDVQYVIYVQSLADITQGRMGLLETTARTSWLP